MEIERIDDKELQEPVLQKEKKEDTEFENVKTKKIHVKWPSKKKVAAEVLAVVLGSGVMFMLISAGDAIGMWLVQGVAKILG